MLKLLVNEGLVAWELCLQGRGIRAVSSYPPETLHRQTVDDRQVPTRFPQNSPLLLFKRAVPKVSSFDLARQHDRSPDLLVKVLKVDDLRNLHLLFSQDPMHIYLRCKAVTDFRQDTQVELLVGKIDSVDVG